MENLLCIKGRVLGKEKPLVCVPIMATTKAEIIKEAKRLAWLHVDMIEWRVDAFAQVRSALRHTCRVMRPPFSFPRKKTGVARPKERRFPLQASSSKSCNACRLHCP